MRSSYLRHFRNGAVLLLVGVMAIDALPSCHLAHQRAQVRLDPLLDQTGLWQGNWNLFAPDVDKLNACLLAEFYSSDGRTYRWQSPDPAKMGPVEKFRYFRWLEYYDSVRNDNNAAAWPALLTWLVGLPEVVPPGKEIVGSKLWRAWADVSPETLRGPVLYPYRERYLIYETEGVQ